MSGTVVLAVSGRQATTVNCTAVTTFTMSVGVMITWNFRARLRRAVLPTRASTWAIKCRAGADRQDLPSQFSFEESRIGSAEDYGPVAINQDPPIEVVPDRAGENVFLEISAFANEVRYALAVADSNHVLSDDRAFVEFCRDVVAAGADYFYATVMRGVIRSRTGKCGQEGVMNVDDTIRQRIHEAVR